MAIALDNLHKSYGELHVIRGVTHRFPERGVVAITGKSGSGKTTLLHMILGLIPPDSGEITGVSQMGAVFQEDRLIGSLSVAANLKLIERDERLIDRHLREVGLYEFRGEPIFALSGGMKRRLAIARAVMYPCESMAMDEPFKGLDADTRAEVISYVLNACPERLILFVSHEPEELERMAPVDEICL